MLTEEQKSQIVEDYTSGMSMSKAAAKHGVSQSWVHHLLKQKGKKARSRMKYTMDESFFERVDSHEKAQILGFLWADGCLHLRDDGGASFIVLALNPKDCDYMEWILAQMKATHKIHYYISKKGVKYAKFVITQHKPIRDIQGLGIHPRKSLVIGFPTTEQVPEQFVNSFVLGVFEGDGCIHLKKGGGGAGATAQFAATINFNERLKEILSALEIESKIYLSNQSKGKNFCRLDIVKKESIFKLMEWMYRDSSHRMERKHRLFRELRARYDSNLEFIETDEFKAGRAEKLRKVRDSWTLNEDGRRRMSESGGKTLRRSCVEFHVKSPAGQIYHANTISDFAVEMGLHIICFHALIRQRGTCRSYKRWTLPSQEEIETARAAGQIIKKLYRQPIPV